MPWGNANLDEDDDQNEEEEDCNDRENLSNHRVVQQQ